MLQVRSFDITDDKGMNELLSNFRIAKGAHVFVSEGKICIPFDDGKPMNGAQRAAMINELISEHDQQLFLLEHSERVNTQTLIDAKEEYARAEEAFKQAPNDKELERAKDAAKNRLSQLENQTLMNQAEIKRVKTNIDCFNELLSDIE